MSAHHRYAPEISQLQNRSYEIQKRGWPIIKLFQLWSIQEKIEHLRLLQACEEVEDWLRVLESLPIEYCDERGVIILDGTRCRVSDCGSMGDSNFSSCDHRLNLSIESLEPDRELYVRFETDMFACLAGSYEYCSLQVKDSALPFGEINHWWKGNGYNDRPKFVDSALTTLRQIARQSGALR
jgi:hypothetical protein